MTVNRAVVARSEEVAEAAMADFVARAGEEAGVVLTSVAGAGKSTSSAARSALRVGRRCALRPVLRPTSRLSLGREDRPPEPRGTGDLRAC